MQSQAHRTYAVRRQMEITLGWGYVPGKGQESSCRGAGNGLFLSLGTHTGSNTCSSTRVMCTLLCVHVNTEIYLS